MSDFEEEFEIPASTEVDPAAEFLAKEQVGDLDNSKKKCSNITVESPPYAFCFSQLVELEA